MFEGIDSYNLKKKISEINSNTLEISDAVEKLQPKDQHPLWIQSIKLPDRPLDSVLLFLQTPMNMEQYLVTHSDLIRSRKMHIIDNDIMNKYAELKKSSLKVTEIPELLIFENLNETEKKKLCERLSFKIKRFTEFMRAFSVVDEDIKPIMLYYSINYFLTFLSDVLLRFGERKAHHGLSGVMNLTIQRNGAFARIVDSFFALEKPTIFSPYREGLNEYDFMEKGIYADEGLDKYGNVKNNFTEHIEEIRGMYELYEYTKSPQLSLKELIKIRFILYKHLKKSKEISLCKISNENLILVDYLLLFIAGSIARYDPINWRKIQNSSNEEYEKIKYHINAAQTNMLNEWIPYLISEHILPLELINKLDVS